MPQLDDIHANSSPAMDALLTRRLQAAHAASTGENGEVNFDWLVMYIWLSMTDSLQAAYARANCCVLAGDDGKKAFDMCISRMNKSFRRVLPVVLPLMCEFSSAKEIRQWRNAGGAVRAVSDPAFLQRGWEAGIPLSVKDIVYAMGPQGPFGRIVFMDTARSVHLAMPA